MIVYLCHQFGGDDTNRIHVETLIIELYKQHAEWLIKNEFSPLSPIHASGYLYSAMPYHDGMRICLDMLNVCDYLMVFDGYSDSRGCQIEQDFCHKAEIPVIFYDDFIKDPDGIFNAVRRAYGLGYVADTSEASRAFITSLVQRFEDMENNSVQIEEKGL